MFEAKPRWAGTIGAGGVAAAGTTTIPLSSAAELDNGDAYIVVINRVTPAGAKNDLAEMETVIGELSGTNLINCVRGVEGTAQAYDAGTVVEILFTATHWNKLIEAWETEHNQDGTHSDITATSVAINGGDVAQGWVGITETLTYASATTITVASGAASRYQKGDKLKITQTTDKYFYIVGVDDTVLTVTGGSDYTLEDEAITSPQLSRIENPFGFPSYFNFSFSSISASGSMTVTAVADTFSNFNIINGIIFIRLKSSFTLGGTVSNTIYLNGLPIAVDGNSNNINVGNAFMLAKNYLLQTYIDSSNDRIRLYNIDFSNYTLGAYGVAGTFYYLI